MISRDTISQFIITSQSIETHLLKEIKSKDSTTKVTVKQTSLGCIHVKIITNQFNDKSLVEREDYIDKILEEIGINLGQYPITNYKLLTPRENDAEPPEGVQLPLWSDVLMAPKLEHQAVVEENISKRPHIVTFYSFKGGVGRSTALGIVATLLASRNRQVVMIDFDLQSPGISVLFRSENANESREEHCGVLDYLHQRYLTPDQNIPAIEDCIEQIDLPGHSEIFLIPAGEYNENYIHRLAELDRRTWQSFYSGSINPVNQLIEDIKATLDPDIILIDARPGFNDTGAIALLDLADTGIICFSPTDQSFKGLQWVIQATRKQFDYRGKPDLRFLLTPMPALPEDQIYRWITRVEDWITESWELPEGVSIEEMYYKVLYNPNIAVLSNLLKVPENLLNDYLPIADAIDASLPERQTIISSEKMGSYARILEELEFKSARAQDLDVSDIPNIFQRTENFPKFLSNRIWLIRGAKGTGKSILFRLFVEQSEQAKDLAKTDIDLTHFKFVAGHGESRLSSSILNGENLASYEREMGEDYWADFWLNYTLLQLCVQMPELSCLSEINNEFIELIQLGNENNLTQNTIVNWLVQRARSSFGISHANDKLIRIDRWLSQQGKSVWLLYDELDVGFGFGSLSYARRKRSLEALLGCWLGSGAGLKQITPKVFLREDIWNQLNFENKGHYNTGKSVRLSWQEPDLWKLVLRQSLRSSENFRLILQKEQGINLDGLEIVSLQQLRQALYPLWGERMGSGKKAYTYNWIRTRIADSSEICFPRSLILLLQQAVSREKDFTTPYNNEIVLRPRSLLDAFPYISEQRVEEVRNEYPELIEPLNTLARERSPIDEDRLAAIWDLGTSDLSLRIKEMVDAGIFKERSRPKDPPPRIYAVAELYLYGLGMTRKGQR